MKLTKSVIDKATYLGGWDVRWDTQVPGFGFRVYPSGRKSFVIRYRAKGVKRYMALGNYGVLTLDQARDMARRRFAEVIEGGDPLQVKRRELQGETVADLCRAYLERHAKLHKTSWREDEKKIEGLILPNLGTQKVRVITRAQVAAFHNKVGEKAPYQANRLLSLLGKMFELARRWGFLDEGATNPARGIDRFKERKRDRWLSQEELPRLAKAIAKEQNLYIRAAIWLYLLTGVRKSELLNARWDDIDPSRGELRLGETKADRVHYVPLSAPALAILRELPRIHGNPYILPGQRHGRPLVELKKAWERIRTDAEVADVRLHDLRRTVGSWLAQSGSSLHLIGRVLNHSNPSTTKVYARFGEDHVRVALEGHGQKLIASLGDVPMFENGEKDVSGKTDG